MKIRLIVVGKTDKKALENLIDIYSKRILHYVKFEWVFIPDLKKRKHMNIGAQKDAEGEKILAKINNNEVLILFDEKGAAHSSLSFSEFLNKQMVAGASTLTFVIGGPYGFSKAIYERSQHLISLSPMTFSHQMVRLIAVEQIYRALTILKNEPYHHS